MRYCVKCKQHIPENEFYAHYAACAGIVKEEPKKRGRKVKEEPAEDQEDGTDY